MRLISWESVFVSSAIAIGFGVDLSQASAQTVSPADLVPTAPPLIPVNPESQNLLLPPSEELLKPSNPKPTELYPQLNPPSSTDTSTDTFTVREFQIVGSTVFSTEELAATVQSFTDRRSHLPIFCKLDRRSLISIFAMATLLRGHLFPHKRLIMVSSLFR